MSIKKYIDSGKFPSEIKIYVTRQLKNCGFHKISFRDNINDYD